jgi:uncharacterized iron-regulated protein
MCIARSQADTLPAAVYNHSIYPRGATMLHVLRLTLCAACIAAVAIALLPGFASADEASPARRVFATAPGATWARSGMLEWDKFMEQVNLADVVFLGEYHDDPNTHVLQFEILSQLYDMREGQVALSMEQFERDVQSALDAYLAGQTDEAAFLAASRPWPNYDPDYKRLIEFSKAHNVPVCAANIPRPLASRIAKQGFDAAWAGYTPEERPWVATETTAPKDAYYELFGQVMGGGDTHGGGMQMSPDMLYSIYQAQCIKDDTMAESIARLRSADPARLVVHTNGSFHCDYRLGTVMRVVARRSPPVTDRPDRVLVIAIRPVSGWSQANPHAEDLPGTTDTEPAAPVADYVLFVPGPEFGKTNPAVPPTPKPAEAEEQMPEGQPPAMPAMPPATPPAVPTTPPAMPPQMPPAK